jgi:PAS domain S-box-containing protein
MAQARLARHSLRRRITFSTLLIFLASIWALSYYASRMLREDMERMLADQQSSTVSYVAGELNDAFEERVLALEKVARSIDPAMLGQPATLQKMLENRLILQGMFNSGVVAVSQDGTAVADVPVVAGRRGTSYASNVATHTALTEGKSVIGRPLVGRVLKEPLFNINAPIRDGQGKVIGALFGVISLAKPNFLDRVGEQRYGKSGGYLVMDQQNNLIVTATEKSRVLQPLPAPGTNEMNDRRRQGFLGTAISTNSLGVEVLSSAARIPAPGWLVVAALPTEEAFAPIRDMQRRIVLAAILLILIAGMISWWLLRRQFAPLHAAVQSLAGMSEANKPLQPLPIAKQDEIGQLVGGFNQLLATLGKHEAQLKTERDFFSAVLQQSSDGVALFDPHDSRIEEVNPSVCHMLGYQREELLGLKYNELLDTDLERAPKNVRRILQDKLPLVTERNLRKKDGALIAVELNVGLVETGGRQLIMVNLRDLTERKQAEHRLQETNAQLERAKAVAEKANLAKSEFLSSMSHELRSPLTAVLGFAQLMEFQKPAPSVAQKQSIDQILKAGWFLLSLINEILDLAKIESGKVTMSQESMSLSEVLQDCQAMIEPQAQQHGIEVTFPSLDNPLYVHADRTRVKQVVVNLLSNAIKYNRVGGTVDVQCTLSGKSRLRVSVRDTGPGLAPEQLAQLFQPFNRLGQESGTEEGTGIGLVVTKQLVELMGGIIGVESSVGVGSVFWFELAASSAPNFLSGSVGETGADEPDHVAVNELSSQRTVLYADDNPMNLALVGQFVALRSDLKLLTASDGHVGIQLARAHQPDVILMDIRMPGLNGFGALKVLREDPATAHIPVMALSANALPRDIEMGIEAGFFRYLTKPIKFRELMDSLDVALRYAAENRQATSR